MRWTELPERNGKYKGVHKRFLRWADRGVWDRLFDDLVAHRKNPYLMLDSIIVRAHQQAATGHEKGQRQGTGAYPRRFEYQDSPAGNGLGERVGFRLTGGQAGEFAEALPCWLVPAKIVMADRGYDSNTIVAVIGAEAVICIEDLPESAAPTRLHLAQTAQPHRKLLQPAQAIPQTRHPILQTQSTVPGRVYRCAR